MAISRFANAAKISMDGSDGAYMFREEKKPQLKVNVSNSVSEDSPVVEASPECVLPTSIPPNCDLDHNSRERIDIGRSWLILASVLIPSIVLMELVSISLTSAGRAWAAAQFLPRAAVLFYFLPAFVAIGRGTAPATVLLHNLAVGWTVVGWFRMMRKACSASSSFRANWIDGMRFCGIMGAISFGSFLLIGDSALVFAPKLDWLLIAYFAAFNASLISATRLDYRNAVTSDCQRILWASLLCSIFFSSSFWMFAPGMLYTDFLLERGYVDFRAPILWIDVVAGSIFAVVATGLGLLLYEGICHGSRRIRALKCLTLVSTLIVGQILLQIRIHLPLGIWLEIPAVFFALAYMAVGVISASSDEALHNTKRLS